MSSTVSLFETNLFDLTDSNFFPWAFIFIAAGPFTWNIIARVEFHTHFLSKIFGSRLTANYVLAFYILAIGFYRDYCFTAAIASQPRVAELSSDAVWYIGAACIAIGQVLKQKRSQMNFINKLKTRFLF
jgi:phosphatidylethanolamine N-methyltransferase